MSGYKAIKAKASKKSTRYTESSSGRCPKREYSHSQPSGRDRSDRDIDRGRDDRSHDRSRSKSLPLWDMKDHVISKMVRGMSRSLIL